MLRILSAYFHGLVDVVRAFWHIVTLQHRNTYRSRIRIDAPRDKVWDLLVRSDVTYEGFNLRTLRRPDETGDGTILFDILAGGTARGLIAFRYLEMTPPSRLTVEYDRTRTTMLTGIGGDDWLRYDLAERPGRGTELAMTRRLTHLKAATRITAPMSLRSAGYMIKQQAEVEAGTRKAADRPLGQQLLWAPLAFASFAWMFGWVDALILMALIAIHEIGHALAMLAFGLGVSVISFIPFFGGVAAPKRAYQNEWQRAIVLLMGVGFSLPVAAGLLWAAHATADPVVAKAASLFAVVNGINLLPVPMLDGGGVASMLLRRFHRRLAQAVGVAMLAIVAGFAAWLADPMLWVLLALAVVSFVQVSALKIEDALPPISRGRAVVVAGLYIGLIAAYVVLSHAAIMFDVSLDIPA